MTTFKTYSEKVDSFKTGDIILFESPRVGSRLIEIGSNSPYSHVAMVVRFDDVNEPLLWESSLIDNLQDNISKIAKQGVHLVSLKAVLDHCGLTYDYLFAVRRLSCTFTPEMTDKLKAFMNSVDGIAFPTIPNFVLQYADGRYFEIAGDKNKTFFCSELLTDTLKHVGLMAQDVLPNSVSPGNYSTYAPKTEVKLLNGNTFSKEEFFIADGQVYVTHSLWARFKTWIGGIWAKIVGVFK